MTTHPAHAETSAELLGDIMMTLSRGLNDLQEARPELWRAVISALGLHLETAEQIAAVTRPFRALPIDDATLGRIGWPRLRLISPRIDADNWRDLVQAAQTCSLEELRALVQQGATGSNHRTVLLTFTAEQHAVFESVLLDHGAERKPDGLAGREAALMAALSKASDHSASNE
jgi:hypothetical protein